MTLPRRTKLVAATVFVAFFGLTKDTDYCRFTSESRSCVRVWGIPVPFTSRYDPGFRPWLEELGAKFPQDYRDYLNFHPLLFVSSTPPGNWLFLRSLKGVYDHRESSHARIAQFLQEVATRNPPLISSDDLETMHSIGKGVP
jgi:hypothetical protein